MVLFPLRSEHAWSEAVKTEDSSVSCGANSDYRCGYWLASCERRVWRKGASSWSKTRVLQSLASASATRVISFHLLASQQLVIQSPSMPLNLPNFPRHCHGLAMDGKAVCLLLRLRTVCVLWVVLGEEIRAFIKSLCVVDILTAIKPTPTPTRNDRLRAKTCVSAHGGAKPRW
ncbi:hypothetical protein BDP81DRAFT_204790 [Colletotrichum phormii]|uniref:Uncharacterized protein n=1 Tax=Colletotrichum phormii TaxID=359342 RepID=A0AAJ0EGR3_9PEZI|nr:uncharacterized protein BDP81DRAFT_204790 [Colletotrichum phormii]KAK1638259.1 hypothetical protein BDP81DRAFT_204790 [Colletotrichum phormii]